MQSVVNNPMQLSGRGFLRIFYMKLFLLQLYVFWLFTTLCTGWILKKRTRKLVFLQTCQKSTILKNQQKLRVYFPPHSYRLKAGPQNWN